MKLSAKRQYRMTNFGSQIVQENSHKTHKIYKSKEKLTHIISINFEHVKISQKQSKTYQEHIVIFEIFVKKSKRTGGPNSKNRGAHSKKVKN